MPQNAIPSGTFLPNFIGFMSIDSTGGILTGGKRYAIMKIQTTKEGMDMKRKIMLTVAILTAVLLLLALASCGALKNNPTLLWLRVNRAMNKLDSYEIDTDMKMVFYVNGHPVTSKATGRTIEMDVGKKSQ